jgi:hypothetical protein
MQGVTDVLGQNLPACDPTGPKCFAVIPWTDPFELMTTDNDKTFQIYRFSGGTTSNRVLASLTNRTEWNISQGAGDAWPPVKAIGTSIYVSKESGAQARYWWYANYGGVKSFNLDNDSGWAYTFFAAGKDNSNVGFGVDHTDGGIRAPTDYNSEAKSLFLYVRNKVSSHPISIHQDARRRDDGTYEANCNDYRQEFRYTGATGNGMYWIQPDSKRSPFKAYCEMTADDGGWTRFWWYRAGTSLTGVTDFLGQDLWLCDPNDPKCLAIIPWSNPSELMTSSDEKTFQIYEFHGGTTANRAKASLTSRTRWDYGKGAGDAWPPVRAVGTTPYRSAESGEQARYWWYGPMQSVLSFHLDNDSGWCYTFFSAGWDNNGGFGVDHTDNGCASLNSTSNNLFLYAR